MKKLLAIFALSAFSVSLAHAGVLFEPFVGFENGSYEVGSSEGDVAGATYGARLGMTTMGFMFGGEYSLTAGKRKPDGATPDSDADLTDTGVFVGYEFPVMFRIYATYFVSSKLDDENLNDDYKGTGTRIGIGYTGLPFIAINVEMINRTYDEYGSIDLTNDLKTSTFAVNISLPLP